MRDRAIPRRWKRSPSRGARRKRMPTAEGRGQAGPSISALNILVDLTFTLNLQTAKIPKCNHHTNSHLRFKIPNHRLYRRFAKFIGFSIGFCGHWSAVCDIDRLYGVWGSVSSFNGNTCFPTVSCDMRSCRGAYLGLCCPDRQDQCILHLVCFTWWWMLIND